MYSANFYLTYPFCTLRSIDPVSYTHLAAIQQGQAVKQEDLDNLQAILTFLQELDTAEVGTHILEGVGEGMTAAGWDSDDKSVETISE